MTALLLTDDEVREITGRERYDAQVAVLRALGIEHKVRPDRSIVVLRSHVESVLSGTTSRPAPKKKQPDWKALERINAKVPPKARK